MYKRHFKNLVIYDFKFKQIRKRCTIENFFFETRKEKGLLLFLLLFMILPEALGSTIKQQQKINQKE